MKVKESYTYTISESEMRTVLFKHFKEKTKEDENLDLTVIVQGEGRAGEITVSYTVFKHKNNI